MERKEAYAKIKELNLQEECKKKYGKNFTQCKTNELTHLIQSFTIKEKKTNEINTVGTSAKSTMSIVFDLIKTLHSKHILLDSEVKRILG